ncbi:ABC transporter permease [Paenarthrobacter sp. DKR-5]|uniref:ABC transporter permease n=1 Tax=Paenarthrobacter sp. DKR-5 TaxID=2835535 RepID=UPI001BDBC4BF|nr:ABC transporter permease subunit [Paenarthrobacter sp. DKR-5]MBT1004003.1 ABC transporter permease [Paenarthrobacter sp. DKR-5]
MSASVSAPRSRSRTPGYGFPAAAFLAVAGKEIRDAFRDRTLLILTLALTGLVAVSVLGASFAFHDKVTAYQAAVAQLKAAGQPTNILTVPQYSPLQMLRNSIEYIEIVGAVLAVLLGHLSVARERRSRTMDLILTRPVHPLAYIGGKIAGAAVLLTAVSAVLFGFAGLSLGLLGSVPLTGAEWVKVLTAAAAAAAYLMIFFLTGAALAAVIGNQSAALVLALALWVAFVLVLPQIGDTMDVDNMVPGGLFNSLHLAKDQQSTVLGHLQGYEWVRNATEVLSPTKHFERLDFAVLGIKDMYNGHPLAEILRARADNTITLACVLTAALAATVTGFALKRNDWRN